MNKFIPNFKNARIDLPFKKVNEVILDEIYKVNGVFCVSAGKYDTHYFVSLEKDNEFFNFGLPAAQNENAKTICSDEESVKAINEGKCGIKINTYHSKKYNRDCKCVEWVNIKPL